MIDEYENRIRTERLEIATRLMCAALSSGKISLIDEAGIKGFVELTNRLIDETRIGWYGPGVTYPCGCRSAGPKMEPPWYCADHNSRGPR